MAPFSPFIGAFFVSYHRIMKLLDKRKDLALQDGTLKGQSTRSEARELLSVGCRSGSLKIKQGG